MSSSETARRAHPFLRATVLSALILAAALFRLLPHPPNFTPIGAIALFGGAHFATRMPAMLVPLAAMALSDLGLHWLRGSGFHSLMPVVYGCIAWIAWIGGKLRNDSHPTRIAGMSILAATWFFLITNLAVWLRGGLYPPTLDGLRDCYLAALPFYGNTLASQLVFGAILFGGFALAERRFPILAEPAATPS